MRAQLHRGESHCLSHAEIFFVTLALVLSWEPLPHFALFPFHGRQRRSGRTPFRRLRHPASRPQQIPSSSIVTRILTARPKRFSQSCANPPPAAIAIHALNTTLWSTSLPCCTMLSASKLSLVVAPVRFSAWPPSLS